MKKRELLDALENGREAFLELIEGLPDDVFQQSGSQDRWSIKDILYHLTRWEAELIKLLWQLQQGQKPTTVHFSRISVDEINRLWRDEGQYRLLERVLADFHAVRNQTIRRVEGFSDAELTTANRYSWLQDRPLWEWIASDSFEHEQEHAEAIRAFISNSTGSTG